LKTRQKFGENLRGLFKKTKFGGEKKTMEKGPAGSGVLKGMPKGPKVFEGGGDISETALNYFRALEATETAKKRENLGKGRLPTAATVEKGKLPGKRNLKAARKVVPNAVPMITGNSCPGKDTNKR